MRGISLADANYGCGGIMKVLTGLTRFGLVFYHQGFKNPLEASRELRRIQANGQNAIIVAVGRKEDAPSNFATLIGTSNGWTWVYANHGWGGSFRQLDSVDGPPVIKHKVSLPKWENTIYYVVPGTPGNSPGFGEGPFSKGDPVCQLPGFLPLPTVGGS